MNAAAAGMAALPVVAVLIGLVYALGPSAPAVDLPPPFPVPSQPELAVTSHLDLAQGGAIDLVRVESTPWPFLCVVLTPKEGASSMHCDGDAIPAKRTP